MAKELLSNMSAFGDDEDEDEDDDSESDGEELDEIPVQESRSNAVYNSVVLHEKLEEISWPGDLDWLQTLTVTYSEPGDIDVNDDLAREMAFYTQALEGTREAYMKLQNLGIPYLRPPDYYAEMVKSDTHMLKVKDVLLHQQKQVEEAEERRKSREAKRFSKEVQAQKLKERAQQKKQNIESVKKWRKMRQDSDFADGDDQFPESDFGEEKHAGNRKRKWHDGQYGLQGGFKGEQSRLGFNSPVQKGHGKQGGSMGFQGRGGVRAKQNASRSAPWDRSGGKGKFKAGVEGSGSKSRQVRNAKYGHGGRKSFKKENTAESSAGLFGQKRKRSIL